MAKNKGKSSSNKIVIGIILILMAGLGIWFYLTPIPINWQVNLRPGGTDPYDTQVLHRLLQKVRNDQTFYSINDSLEIRLKDSSEVVDNYVYIGEEQYVDSAEIVAIKQFLNDGNKVFVFVPGNSNPLLRELIRSSNQDFYLTEDQYDSHELISAHIYETSDTNTIASIDDIRAPYSLYRDFKKTYYSYYYFLDSLMSIDSTRMETIGVYRRPNDIGGEEMEYPEYIRFKYGKGDLYFHCNPIRFTNYYCLNDTLLPYIEKVFDQLGPGKVIWDEESRNYENNWDEQSPQLPSEGPLEFILSEPSLSRAWYLLIAGVILYLAFGAKRKQRVIPVTENMENTSIEYAETIAQLFMKQKDHSKLVKLKVELFKSYLRERLKMSVPVHSEKWDETFVSTLVQRSGIRNELISTLVSQCKKYEAPENVQTENMLEFHNNLEEFYFYCK